MCTESSKGPNNHVCVVFGKFKSLCTPTFHAVVQLLNPTAHPSPTLSQTSSSIISAHKCPESEDVSLHSIAVTSEPNNQSEQQSTQPLKNKNKFKKKGSHPQHLFRTSIPMYLIRDQY